MTIIMVSAYFNFVISNSKEFVQRLVSLPRFGIIELGFLNCCDSFTLLYLKPQFNDLKGSPHTLIT